MADELERREKAVKDIGRYEWKISIPDIHEDLKDE